jgi:hypothetical protein
MLVLAILALSTFDPSHAKLPDPRNPRGARLQQSLAEMRQARVAA